MKALFASAFLLVSTASFSQYLPLGAITMPVEGYVVTESGDTLWGKVRVASMVNESPATVVVEGPERGRKKFRSDELRTVFQRIPAFAYATGSIPRQRQAVVFDRIRHPGRGGKAVLVERLTEAGDPVGLYFDATGWKRNVEFTFGNFELATLPEDLSYILVEDGQPGRLVRKRELTRR